ncbi:YjzD family protein [Weissella ceti]|uniref:YjzD family protein n=1 Tax=Weissella ceti TaxID=759620 RepID=A0ABT3E3H3_9LACO|nr:DUF2929 family protein [Weissella ceti]MCW0952970.1 YjzD family protein [Weissella ceti]QVK11513.1 DUF2929 family protein [Weissella ceti]
MMKYVNLFVWMFILGEVLGYISSALQGVAYDATATALFSAVMGVVGVVMFFVISRSANPTKS